MASGPHVSQSTRVNSLSAALGLAVSAGPVVYPAWLAAKGWRLGDQAPPVVENWPALSVVIPAYREQGVIADKVADLLANGYPGELEVLVVADDRATAAVAGTTSARVIENHDRRGKAAALGRGVAAAAGEIIVMTDANTVLSPGSLTALVRWFADGSVGAVAGEKQVESMGEGIYWRYESWLKRREFRLGSTIGLVGELAAIRRSAWSPLPVDVAVDDLWIALDVLGRGWRVAYEPQAVALEAAAEHWDETWERRTRVVAGTFDLMWRRRSLLVGADLVAAELWGHKLLRQSVGPLAHLLGIVLAFRASRRSVFAAVVVTGHVAGAAAAVGLLMNRTVPRVAAVGGEVLFLHTVALAGLVRYLRGDRPAVWIKPERKGGLPTVHGGRHTYNGPSGA